MTSPQAPRSWVAPGAPAGTPFGAPGAGRPEPAFDTTVLVLAVLAALSWMGAAFGGWFILIGRDEIEGMLSFVGLLGLAGGELTALVLTAVTAWELRRRGMTRAAVIAGLVAVAGVVVTILFLRWVV